MMFYHQDAGDKITVFSPWLAIQNSSSTPLVFITSTTRDIMALLEITRHPLSRYHPPNFRLEIKRCGHLPKKLRSFHGISSKFGGEAVGNLLSCGSFVVSFWAVLDFAPKLCVLLGSYAITSFITQSLTCLMN